MLHADIIELLPRIRIDPRDKYWKKATFDECVGDELPYGWECMLRRDGDCALSCHVIEAL